MAQTKSGRPRSAHADSAILSATLAELEESGYQGLTIESVARRAGVGRPTIYRRWPNKATLVVYALSQSVPHPTAPETEDPLADLVEVLTSFLLGIGSSPAARAVLAVHAAGSHSAELRMTLHEHYLSARVDAFSETVDRARRQGALRPDVTNDQVRDLLVGPAIYHWLIMAEMPNHEELGELLHLGVQAITASGDSPRDRPAG